MPKSAGTTQLPFPSLIRASSFDVANQRMRAAGRKKWSRGDYNAAARFHNETVERCFGKGATGAFKFSIADALDKAGALYLGMPAKKFFAAVDAAFASAFPEGPPVEAA